MGELSAVPSDRIARLLEAACAIDLARRRGPDRRGEMRYGLGPLGAALVGNHGVQAMITHHALLYDDLRDPVAMLRHPERPTTLSRFWSYEPGDGNATDDDARAGSTGPYTALMSLSAELVADEIVSACDLSGARRLLDVGGGDGTVALRLARRWRRLHVTTADLGPVVARARRNFDRSRFTDRLEVHALDIHRDDWRDADQRAGRTPGPDTVLLSRVLHDHDDAPVLALLDRARATLAPGGRLIVAEPMADPRASRRVADAYFGLYLLAMGSGRPRSPDALSAMLRRSGFDRIRLVRTRNGPMATIIVAR